MNPYFENNLKHFHQKNNMKTTKIIYWITTSIICLFASSAIMMNSQMAIEGTTHLGIPRYLGIEVSIAQLIGAVVLFVPAISTKLKEWAYVGFGIMYLTAINAHLAIGYHLDSTVVPKFDDKKDLIGIIMATIFFGLLVLSYLSFHKLQAAKTKV
jgi:DoxX-like family